ncbi:hypothetical protein [Zooshikella harenae]|uniref:Uncharacterized protein n=1 Tax=Zooshikella harenae TaxID=2827238 RepID=A0ABS5ZJD2_9GAMM|nr:hypothetical protein [Zooshikella harenae]MBU2714074.1 hypothetical protein [Zooshikella harenae]
MNTEPDDWHWLKVADNVGLTCGMNLTKNWRAAVVIAVIWCLGVALLCYALWSI